MACKHFIFFPGIRERKGHPTTAHKIGTFLKLKAVMTGQLICKFTLYGGKYNSFPHQGNIAWQTFWLKVSLTQARTCSLETACTMLPHPTRYDVCGHFTFICLSLERHPPPPLLAWPEKLSFGAALFQKAFLSMELHCITDLCLTSGYPSATISLFSNGAPPHQSYFMNQTAPLSLLRPFYNGVSPIHCARFDIRIALSLSFCKHFLYKAVPTASLTSVACQVLSINMFSPSYTWPKTEEVWWKGHVI